MFNLPDVETLKEEISNNGASLLEIERRYRLLTENAGDVIWTVDLNNKPSYISPSIERLIGYSPEEAIQLSMEDVFTAESVQSIIHELNVSLGQEQEGRGEYGGVKMLELGMVHKNGKIVPVEGSFSFVRDENGRPVEILAITRDISERRRINEQLLITENMAVVGEMVGGLAREVKTALSRIINLSECLLGKYQNEGSEEIAIIHHEALRSAAVVKHFLDISNTGQKEKQPLNINTIIAAVLNLRSDEHKKNRIKVVTRLLAGMPPVMASNLGIQQVILNIISNAEYFMIKSNQKGTINIETRIEGNFVCTDIKNDGPPIEEVHLSRIFEPFFTTRNKGQGTGLGLYICRKIIDEHGGRLYAENCPGGGVGFTVELPVWSDDIHRADKR